MTRNCSEPPSAPANQEAEIFGHYILGTKPDRQSVELYKAASTKLDFGMRGPTDRRVLTFVLTHPSFLGLADSSHALFTPQSLLRKKLHVMFAILESRPQYAHLFLPDKRKPHGVIYAGWVGARALCQAILGRIILCFV